MAAALPAVQSLAIPTNVPTPELPVLPLVDLISRDPISLGAREWSLLSLIKALVSRSIPEHERKQWICRASEVLRVYDAKTEPECRNRCIPVLMLALKPLPEDEAGKLMSVCEALRTLCRSCFAVVSHDTTRFEQQTPHAVRTTNNATMVDEETQHFAGETYEKDLEDVLGEQKEKSQTACVQRKAHVVPSLVPVESQNNMHSQPGALANDDHLSWNMRSPEERKILKRFRKPGTSLCFRCLNPGHGFKDFDAPCRGQSMAPFEEGKILIMLHESGNTYVSGASQSSHTTSRSRTTSYAASQYHSFPSSSRSRSGYDTNTSYTQQRSVGNPGFIAQTSIKPFWPSPAPAPAGTEILEGEHASVAEQMCGNTGIQVSNTLPAKASVPQHVVDDDLGRFKEVPMIEIFFPDPESSSYCETSNHRPNSSAAKEQHEVKKKIVAGEYDYLGCGRHIESKILVERLLPDGRWVVDRPRRSKTWPFVSSMTQSMEMDVLSSAIVDEDLEAS